MSKFAKNSSRSASQIAEEVVQRLRDRQSTMRFDGTLKVDPTRVFVDRKDGLRALEQLKRFSTQKQTER